MRISGLLSSWRSLLGIGIDALLIAAFASRGKPGRPSGLSRLVAVAFALALRRRRRPRLSAAGPAAGAAPMPSPTGHQFRYRRPAPPSPTSAAISWSGSATRRPTASATRRQQSGRRRRIRDHRCAAFPDLGRGLWNFGPHRRAGLFRRRQAPDLGRRCRLRRALAPGVNVGVSIDQSRTVDRRSAGAAVGLARSDPVRLQRLDGQGAMDLGDRAGPRLWQDQFEP